MSTPEADPAREFPIHLEINTNHRYTAGQMGVFEFRIRNQSPAAIPSLRMVVDCACQSSREKTVELKNFAPSSAKNIKFQFEPARGGEALVKIEVCLEDATGLPVIYRGDTSVDIAAQDDARKSGTSFHIDIHDIEKFMGNDLSGMLSLAGGEINSDRLRERMQRKEPFWMRVDLDLDEHETKTRREARRTLLCIPPGETPAPTHRALLEAVEGTAPWRAFIYSAPEIRFGRSVRHNDVVLRFLPDFRNDQRSKTISQEQFVAACRAGRCLLMAVPDARATACVDGLRLLQDKPALITDGIAISIGIHEFGLQVSAGPRDEDPRWQRSLEEIRAAHGGEDAFPDTAWDYVRFVRTTNGPEEQYLWLFRKIDLGWETEPGAALQLGRPARPSARLSFWGGRYYLEALPAGRDIRVGDRLLGRGEIACLGRETEIRFGALAFRWQQLARPEARELSS